MIPLIWKSKVGARMIMAVLVVLLAWASLPAITYAKTVNVEFTAIA